MLHRNHAEWMNAPMWGEIRVLDGASSMRGKPEGCLANEEQFKCRIRLA
jgi:hypothetical protein